ncbi:MAG: riboflavin biosynthesis protein RibF [Deltaproteobacteria bacterium GWA2_50_8]|nr:MAG: riboflavin biosynthesis protein RibF [Deltaproteobacteria bacterium GWA2_50_8]
MNVIFGTEKLKSPIKNPIITLGVFDGVHRGHQHIFELIKKQAKKNRGKSIVYTFNPHPVRQLAPEACPPMLLTLEQKIETIRRQKVDYLIIEAFTPVFSKLSPDKFFQKVIVDRIQAREIYVGYDFTFGCQRSGTIETLEQLGKNHGIGIHIVPAFFLDNTLVSSTRIRQLIAESKMSSASYLLGKHYCIEGHVVTGRGIGGKKLGFHTANIETLNELIPPNGVYATFVKIKHKRHFSVTNIGTNPTFGGKTLSIESHILNFRRNIVGQKICLEFVEKIREEINFSNAMDLSHQIQSDIEIAKSHLRRTRW